MTPSSAVTSFPAIVALIAPVFAMIAAGALARWRNWLRVEAEESLLKLVVNVLTPCLVFRSVIGNRALLAADNVVLPPLVGFVTVAAGFVVGYYGGLLLGLRRGHGLRTFAFAVGIYNYGYIPIPLIESLFGAETLGVLFVHNIGCELAIWSIGVILIAGASLREGWRRAINAPVISIVVAVSLNVAGAGAWIPHAVMRAVGMLGSCAVPLGLVVIGGTLFDFFAQPRQLLDLRVSGASIVLRLALLPLLFLAAASWLPFSTELKQVMIVQAAMPAGITPVLIARHYGGQPITAAQVILATTAVGLLAIPWWIRLGMAWVGN